jgi:hypothetical protein
LPSNGWIDGEIPFGVIVTDAPPTILMHHRAAGEPLNSC